MSEMWLITPQGTGSPLLNPDHTAALYGPQIPDERYAWHVCPIDDAPHNACFYLPGVTDGPAAPTPPSP